jgi:hypothetical protein
VAASDWSSSSQVLRFAWEKSISPPTYEAGTHHLSTYENRFFTPLNFIKQDKSPPKAVLKNHNKSQKNHKMKDQIVLDFKLVVLRSESIIWNVLVHILF